MLVAVPSSSNAGLESSVAEHFGRCPYFTMVNLEDETVTGVSVVENPYYASHAQGRVPMFLSEEGADMILAGGMGRRALAVFTDLGITSLTGASGSVAGAIDDLVAGRLQGTDPCPGGHHHG